MAPRRRRLTTWTALQNASRGSCGWVAGVADAALRRQCTLVVARGRRRGGGRAAPPTSAERIAEEAPEEDAACRGISRGSTCGGRWLGDGGRRSAGCWPVADQRPRRRPRREAVAEAAAEAEAEAAAAAAAEAVAEVWVAFVAARGRRRRGGRRRTITNAPEIYRLVGLVHGGAASAVAWSIAVGSWSDGGVGSALARGGESSTRDSTEPSAAALAMKLLGDPPSTSRTEAPYVLHAQAGESPITSMTLAAVAEAVLARLLMMLGEPATACLQGWILLVPAGRGRPPFAPSRASRGPLPIPVGCSPPLASHTWLLAAGLAAGREEPPLILRPTSNGHCGTCRAGSRGSGGAAPCGCGQATS